MIALSVIPHVCQTASPRTRGCADEGRGLIKVSGEGKGGGNLPYRAQTNQNQPYRFEHVNKEEGRPPTELANYPAAQPDLKGTTPAATRRTQLTPKNRLQTSKVI